MPATDCRWDIFCAVIDNFGDIGICWRLSRQLANEHGVAVRLWVDDLASFKKICPQVDISQTQQHIAGVTIMLWSADTDWQTSGVASVVIEALACNVPMPYQQLMAQQDVKPLWLNLEYLSAESWVEGCHALPSPQPHLALDKYFFFPGFTADTGGLLQEKNLQQLGVQFLADVSAQQQFWQQLGVDNFGHYQQKVSLFGYDHPQIQSLLACWQQPDINTLCLVPEGALAEQLMQLYPELKQRGELILNTLTIKVLPFMPQEDYDKLLWSCDINFVRGEDSVIRAHWAAKPFIWQIYRQEEQAHLDKLNAFIERYCKQMPHIAVQAVKNFWQAWNTDSQLGTQWLQFSVLLPQIAEYNVKWRDLLSQNGDLASNLVHFVENKFIMQRNFS